jgi:nucleotide-binding universal stress UspA family protein
MKNNKYKILVLSDMKDTTANTIKSGVSFAKMIGGDLHFFHVKKPTDIVEKESQLSAMRTINRTYLSTDNDIQDLIEPISKDYDTPISFSHAFGNVKSEISNQIKTYQPDVIILGKRKSKPFNFIGDNITEYVIKNYDGAVMIASEENAIQPNTELSLGILNKINATFDMSFADRLFGHTQKPLKSFKTYNASNKTNEVNPFTEKNTVELVFDHGDNSIKSLSNYLTKSDVNLLCLDRVDENNANHKTDIKNVISNVNVSLLISKS